MCIVALIDEPAVIERIFKHLKAWESPSATCRHMGDGRMARTTIGGSIKPGL